MKGMIILPLLVLSIGVFLWPVGWSICLGTLILIGILIFQRKKALKYLKNLAFLLLFTAPIILSKMFLIHSGMNIQYWLLTFYSDGLKQGFETLVRIWVLSGLSFLITEWMLKKMKERGKDSRLSVFFQSIEIYQDLLGSALSDWKTILKNPSQWIDNVYLEKEPQKKDISPKSGSSRRARG
jgi:hypothetical protein